jgi:hypothetical protein
MPFGLGNSLHAGRSRELSAFIGGDGGCGRRAGHVGRALFKDGESVDPELQRRYRLYKRVEAALALLQDRSAWQPYVPPK